jgi:hypothetical protein
VGQFAMLPVTGQILVGCFGERVPVPGPCQRDAGPACPGRPGHPVPAETVRRSGAAGRGGEGHGAANGRVKGRHIASSAGQIGQPVSGGYP